MKSPPVYYDENDKLGLVGRDSNIVFTVKYAESTVEIFMRIIAVALSEGTFIFSGCLPFDVFKHNPLGAGIDNERVAQSIAHAGTSMNVPADNQTRPFCIDRFPHSPASQASAVG